VHHEAPHVAAELVGAEEVLGARWLQAIDGIEARGIVRRDDAGRERRHQQQQEDGRAHHHTRVAEEPSTHTGSVDR
jgi:hypothetical protein